ncbi:MAG: hypothetical protein HY675_14490, partial [Chloroflexi bacterium]|nr:hypothetical protein [Chloroflexota bacterium]
MAPRAKKVTSPSGQRVEIGEKGVSNKDPFYGSVYLRRYASYLGQWDPSSLGIATMLKMQHHPAISLAEHVIWSPLVNADWDIECGDPVKKRFIRGVIEPIYQKLMLFSLPAITLGFAAYTKQWGNYQPYDEDGKPLWPKTLADDGILPVVPIDLKQLDPLSVQPIVENDGFKGIRQDGFGDIEP